MPYSNDQELIKDENSVLCMAEVSVLGDREEQQDSFGYRFRQNEGIIILCDGMGGSEDGKKASSIATETFLEYYENGTFDFRHPDGLTETAKIADVSVAQIKSDDGRSVKAGTTLVVIFIEGNRLRWCSVGDSRAYLVRNGEMVQLTQDQTYSTVLEEKKRAGLIDEAEFERENVRGEALISFIGMGNLKLIDYSQKPFILEKDDKIIAMSDGLYKIVPDAEILRIVDNFSNIGEAVQALEIKTDKKAKLNGLSRDNMTVAIIKIK